MRQEGNYVFVVFALADGNIWMIKVDSASPNVGKSTNIDSYLRGSLWGKKVCCQ